MRRHSNVLALLATLAFVPCARAGDASCGDGAKAAVKNGAACSVEGNASAVVAKGGKIVGNFDPSMSGVCRYGCATKSAYEASQVVAQPGSRAGKLTQCPVSGVVFSVDKKRPRVKIAGETYVTCCDGCAGKLKKSPRQYLRV
jgi:hypothetical protein